MCLVLSSIWYSPEAKPPSPISLSWFLAIFVLHPLALISGTSLVFYLAEAFGIVRIVRNRSLSIVLLSVILLFSLWIFLSFCAVFSGTPDFISSLISKLPNPIFSKGLGYAFMLHIRDYSVTLLCEALGLGLFIAIGKRDKQLN